MSLTRRERLELRSLDIGYKHHGKGLTYYAQDGMIYPDMVGLVRVVESTGKLADGSDVGDTVLKGYSLRLRSFLFPDGFTPRRGDQIALDRPFDGQHQFFHIDTNPRAFNMSGLQIILGLTPTSDPTAEAAPADELTVRHI